MIGNFPLWMILAVWLLQRAHPARATIYNYPQRKRLLDDMRCSLPVPRSRFEVLLIARILTWLDREAESLWQLQRIGVVATVIVSNN